MEKECTNPAIFRYTWPCKDESFVCAVHAQQLLTVADAIGMHLQLIRLNAALGEEWPNCKQRVANGGDKISKGTKNGM